MVNKAGYLDKIEMFKIVLEEVRRQASISKVSEMRELFEGMTIDHDLQNDLSYETDKEPEKSNLATQIPI
jgi:hypothetical protein